MNALEVAYTPQLWLCKCGRALGYTYRTVGSRITRLAVFAGACCPEHVSVISQEILGYVVLAPAFTVVPKMEAGDVTCTVCGSTRPWKIGDEAFMELVRRRNERSFGLDKGW